MRQRTWFVFAFLINATIKFRPWPWAGCQQLISAAREFQRKEKSGKCETMKPKPIRFSLVAFAVLLPCHHFDKVWNCAVRDLCEMKFHDFWTQHVTPAAAPTLSYRVLHFFAGPLVIVRFFFSLTYRRSSNAIEFCCRFTVLNLSVNTIRRHFWAARAYTTNPNIYCRHHHQSVSVVFNS